MNIKIISIGSRNDINSQSIMNDYMKRLPSNVKVTWTLIKHGVGGENQAKKQESEQIVKNLDENSLRILLDERGTQLSSPELSNKLFSGSKDINFVIGGAYGVDDSVNKSVDFTLSLSKLVYPHQLVRVILAEQIYRAYTISIGHPYHHI